MKTTTSLQLFTFLLAGALDGQSLPTGLVDELVASGFVKPIGLAFLPDGRMLVVEQRTHLLKLVVSGAVTTVGTITGVSNAGFSTERGIQHIAIDPNWPARPYLYLWDTHDTGTCWLSI